MMERLNEYEWLDGRYRLKNKIGQGSFGEVWRVYDTQSNTEMAAKICFSNDERNKSEFEKEYKTTKRLNHPNLVCPKDFGVFGERLFIIMPYCPSSASKMIGCCTDRMMWEFFRDISHGLDYLHRKGVVHHDIKPDNILIDENDRFKISDFGVSTQFGDSSHKGDEAIKGGTEGYMGPELFKPDAESIKATDIWALGATAYEMLSGELPFFGIGGRAQNNGAVLTEMNHYVSSNLMQLIRDCMAKETWDRPTAQEIADYTNILFDESIEHPYWDEYFSHVRGKTKTPYPMREPENVHDDHEISSSFNYQPVKKRKLWWIAAAAAAVAGIVIAWWFAVNANYSQNHGTNGSVMGNNNVHIEKEQPAPVQATYLRIAPKQLHIDSKENGATVQVETDGPDFSIEMPENCIWISQVAKADNSFVLHFMDNLMSTPRSCNIKVTSGALTADLPVQQDPIKEKVPNPQINPTTTKHNQGGSSNGENQKKDRPKKQEPQSDDEPTNPGTRHDPINVPIGNLRPVLY